MNIFIKKKPENTVYCDYMLRSGNVFFVFEKSDNMVETVYVGSTNRTIDDWKNFEVTETETEYCLKIN